VNGTDGFDLAGSGAEPLEEDDPRRIGPIPLVGRLGSGGMGRVYLGVHEGRYAAVKQVLPSIVGEDKDFLRRFGQELDNLSRLPAEATAPLLAGDRDAQPPWLATAYVPGLTLRQAVDLHGPLPAGALWLLLRGARRQLHDGGRLHRRHRAAVGVRFRRHPQERLQRSVSRSRNRLGGHRGHLYLGQDLAALVEGLTPGRAAPHR
jgi:hypothetical protein